MTFKFLKNSTISNYEDILIAIDSLKFKLCIDSYHFIFNYEKGTGNYNSSKNEIISKYFLNLLADLIKVKPNSHFNLPFEFSDQYTGVLRLESKEELDTYFVSYIVYERLISNPFFLLYNEFPEGEILKSKPLGEIKISLFLKSYVKSLGILIDDQNIYKS